MTTDALIDGVLDREGPGVPPEYLDSADKGGRTAWGISEHAHPEAWQPGPPTRDEARAIYLRAYVGPFDVLGLIDDRVRVALVDDAVLSGVGTAIRTLQGVLGVDVDGVIGPKTVAAVHRLGGDWMLTRLVQQRAHRLARIVQVDPTQLRFLVGWIDRCTSLLG